MDRIRKFLVFPGLLIIVVGLIYGAPKATIESAFGVSIDDNALHIFRAVMGLYFGVGFIVLIGARYQEYTKFSLLLAIVFFGAIGAGRLISFVIDGKINSVAAGATAFEILMFVICLVILKTGYKSPAIQKGENNS